ncbi:MAG: 50S ribosomal protein L10 [Andreesenia angusta]|nr:50S ribosomal protein L10 [Andreesenia angusta]
MSEKALQMKQNIVSEIAEKLDKATSCVVVDYKGLTVAEVTELRNKFREADVEYKVLKNTLVRRAAKQINKMEEFNDEKLVGTNAFAISYDDAVAPAKVVKDFAKEHPNLEFKMGYVEGEFYDAANLESLASIPSREELIAKLLGSLKAPISNFAYLLDAIAKQKEEQEA